MDPWASSLLPTAAPLWQPLATGPVAATSPLAAETAADVLGVPQDPFRRNGKQL